MEIMIPQILGIAILVLSFLALIRIFNSKNSNNVLTYIILMPISLVHFGVIPTYIFTLIPIILSFLLTGRIRKYIGLAIIPLIIHMLYVFFLYNPTDLVQYINYYVQLLNDMLFNPGKTITLFTESAPPEFQRGFPYINAFAPAAFLSLTLTGVYTLVRRVIKPPLIMISCLTIGITFLALGFSRLYIFTKIPSASIARYVNIYGLSLIHI